MRKRWVVLAFIMVSMFVFASCGTPQSQNRESIVTNASSEYCDKNNIIPITGAMTDTKEIIVYSSEKENGLVIFSEEDGQVNMFEEKQKFNPDEEISLLQLENGDVCYIAVFIHDEDKAKEVEEISLEFEENENTKLIETSVTHTGEKGALLDYAANEASGIEKVTLYKSDRVKVLERTFKE